MTWYAVTIIAGSALGAALFVSLTAMLLGRFLPWSEDARILAAAPIIALLGGFVNATGAGDGPLAGRWQYMIANWPIYVATTTLGVMVFLGFHFIASTLVKRAK